MKDLDKNVIYDLSDLNREERSELFDYLVNVINPTESNCDKTIENLVGRIIQCKTNELTYGALLQLCLYANYFRHN